MALFTSHYQETIRFLVQKYPWLALLIYGPTGIGKSWVPEEAALEMRRIYEEALKVPKEERTEIQKAEVEKGPVGYAYLNFTACEFADLVGLPFREGDKTVYCPPEWLKEIEQFPRGIAVFDEVNRIEQQTRQAYMQVLDRRQIGKFTLPSGWLIVQTANPADEEYQVSDFDKALVRRSCVMELQFDLETWQTWGMQDFKSKVSGEHLNSRVLALATRLTNKGLIQKVENRIRPIPTAAGLTICGELIEAGVDKLRKDTREAMFSGIVGPEAANMLESSLKDNRLKGLLERALRGDEIKSESQEIMTDLMFLFYDTIAKSPAKYGKQAETLWDSLPGDCKPVFAKACYAWFQKHKKEFAGFKAKWGAWCVKNMEIMKGLADE